MNCPHYQNNSCLILAGHGLLRIAPPGNPNHPCDSCKSRWIEGQPPTAESLTPTLLAIIDMAKPEPRDPDSPKWDVSQPSRGLGDTIAKITHATGIDTVAAGVAKVLGKKCECGRRQAKLNEAVPYGKE